MPGAHGMAFLLVATMLSVSAMAASDDGTCDGDECSQTAPTNFIPTTIDDLAEAAELARIDRVMDDGTIRPTVILITINAGYLPFFQNWLLYFMDLGFGAKFLVMCEDQHVFDFLYSDNDFNFKGLVLDATDEGRLATAYKAVPYNSFEYNVLVSRRPDYILALMEIGYDVLYTDVDTVLFSDPFPYFRDPTVDLFIQSDPGFHGDDPRTKLCTGFMLAKNSPLTTKLMVSWRNRLYVNRGAHVNQEVR